LKNPVFAAIDIGSHNCRLTVVEKINNKIKVIHNYSHGTNLIKNLSYNNEFTNANIKNTLECLKKISKKITSFKVLDYRCIATEACRQVINPEFFVSKVKAETGIDIEIISSFEEAKLSLKSCQKYVYNMNKKGYIFDIGGGSTELTYFDQNKNIFNTKSLSYGVINLSEKKEVYGSNMVNRELKNHFLSCKNFVDKESSTISIGSCSTVTTLCALFQSLDFFNLKKIEGFKMSSTQLLEIANYVSKASKEDLKKTPCVGSRYKLLINGVEILKYLLNTIPIKEIIVTQRGLRDGIIFELLNSNEKN
jgi:exopolyphosphatase/guanosine-5'-triphosphate,3'-diphosphate pyrophosphatase